MEKAESARGEEVKLIEKVVLWGFKAIQVLGDDPESFMEKEGEEHAEEVLDAIRTGTTPAWDFERRKLFFGLQLAKLIRAVSAFVPLYVSDSRVLPMVARHVQGAVEHRSQGMAAEDWRSLHEMFRETKETLDALWVEASHPMSGTDPAERIEIEELEREAVAIAQSLHSLVIVRSLLDEKGEG